MAGFVSRPHSAEVVALLYLRQVEEDQPRQWPAVRDPIPGLTDRALFHDLSGGESRLSLPARRRQRALPGEATASVLLSEHRRRDRPRRAARVAACQRRR